MVASCFHFFEASSVMHYVESFFRPIDLGMGALIPSINQLQAPVQLKHPQDKPLVRRFSANIDKPLLIVLRIIKGSYSFVECPITQALNNRMIIDRCRGHTLKCLK